MAGHNRPIFVLDDIALALLIEGHLISLTDPASGETIDVVLSPLLSWAVILSALTDATRIRLIRIMLNGAQKNGSGLDDYPPDPPQAREFLPNRFTRRDE